MARAPLTTHPLAATAFELLERREDGTYVLAPKSALDLEARLAAYADDPALAWAIASIVALAERLERLGSAAAATGLVEVATTATSALAVQNAERQRARHDGRLLDPPARRLPSTPGAAPEGTPAWTLEPLASRLRRT